MPFEITALRVIAVTNLLASIVLAVEMTNLGNYSLLAVVGIFGEGIIVGVVMFAGALGLESLTAIRRSIERGTARAATSNP